MDRKEGSKPQGSKKSVIQKISGKKGSKQKLKVVDLKRNATAKAKAPESKFRASAKAAQAKSAQAKSAQAKSAQAKLAQSKATQPKPIDGRGKQSAPKSAAGPAGSPASSEKRIAKSGAAGTTTTNKSGIEVTTYFVAPPKAVLRTFRKAAEAGRKNAKNLQRAKANSANFLAKIPKSGKRYTLDLRIHSPATLGFFSTGGVDPGPALVRLAKVKGIDVIGLTDFYNPSFVDPVRELAAKANITLLPGLDLRCQIGDCREVYVIALFPETTTSEQLFAVLEQLQVPKEAYGSRDYCLPQSFAEVIAAIESNGGVVIPSRLDKTPYRQLAIPALIEKFGFHAFDLVHPEHTDFFRDRWPEGLFTFFTFSNANALAQIGSRIAKLRLESPSFEAIKALVSRRAVMSQAPGSRRAG